MDSINLETFPDERPNDQNGGPIVEVGEHGLFISFINKETWDRSTLAKLRATLEKYDVHNIILDLEGVKVLESGFFGFLGNYFDSGMGVFLKSPEETVMRMQWFEIYFREYPEGGDLYQYIDTDIA